MTPPTMPPGACDQFVRLVLGLPEPGVAWTQQNLQAAVRAGLELDGHTAAEGLRIGELLPSLEIAPTPMAPTPTAPRGPAPSTPSGPRR